MKTIKKNELTRLFEIIQENDLSSKAKIEAFIVDKQLEANKVGLLSDKGVAIRKETELIINSLNYLGNIKSSEPVRNFIRDYFG